MKKLSDRRSASLILLSLLVACLLAGCVVPSVNSFFTKDLETDMPAIIGQWSLTESSMKEDLNKQFTFTKDTIITPGEKGSGCILTSHFFKIDDMVFLDLIAAEAPQNNSFWWVLHITPMHTVSRVIVEEKTMKIIPLNARWMEEEVKTKSVALPAVWHREQKYYLFTASSAEWVEFLKKYGKDSQAFQEKDAFVFTRP